MNPRMAEYKSSLPVVFLMRSLLCLAKIIIKKINADVIEAIVNIGRISIWPRLILKAVGIVDQNRIASKA